MAFHSFYTLELLRPLVQLLPIPNKPQPFTKPHLTNHLISETQLRQQLHHLLFKIDFIGIDSQQTYLVDGAVTLELKISLAVVPDLAEELGGFDCVFRDVVVVNLVVDAEGGLGGE